MNFLVKWFYNDDIQPYNKTQLVRHVPSDYLERKREFLDYLIERKSQLGKDQLYDIGYYYLTVGDTNKAIKNFLGLRPDARNFIKIQAIIRLAEVYVKNNEYALAINSLDKLKKYESDKKLICNYIHIGNLYAEAFEFDKSVDSYIKEINFARTINYIKKLILKIIDVCQNDSEIKLSYKAKTNINNTNDTLRLFATGALMAVDNNEDDAWQYFETLLSKENNQKKKYEVWNYLCGFFRKNHDAKAEIYAKRKMYQLATGKQKLYLVNDINNLLIRTTNYNELVNYNMEILNTSTNLKMRDKAYIALYNERLYFGDTNGAWNVTLKLNDAEDLLKFSWRLNKKDELIKEFEKRIRNSEIKNFIVMVNYLAQYNNHYQRNNKSMEELIRIVDTRLPEIKVEDYMKISTFYLTVGKKDKAHVLLEEHYDNAEEKDKKYIRLRINRILNMN